MKHYMGRRICIGIEIPEYAQAFLHKKIELFRFLPIFWSKSDTMYITLASLGYVDDGRLVEICALIGQSIYSVDPFEVVLNSIEVAPDDDHPRFIRVFGESSDPLRDLKQVIETSLELSVSEYKVFFPHIVLGRIRVGKWLLLETRPRIKEEIRLVIPVSSVTIFESLVERGRRKYFPVETCELNGHGT